MHLRGTRRHFQLLDFTGHIRIDLDQRGFDAFPEIGAFAAEKHPQAFAALGRLRVGAAGDHDHLDRFAAGIEQARADREPVQLRHVDVDDHDVGMAVARLDQHLHAVDRGFDLEAHLHAAIGEQSHNGGIVVGDQHLGRPLAVLEYVVHVRLRSCPLGLRHRGKRAGVEIGGHDFRRAAAGTGFDDGLFQRRCRTADGAKLKTPAAPASLCTNDCNSSGTAASSICRRYAASAAASLRRRTEKS